MASILLAVLTAIGLFVLSTVTHVRIILIMIGWCSRDVVGVTCTSRD